MTKSLASQKDEKMVIKIRREFGMRQIKRGKRHCLCCNRIFASPDLAAQKMCFDCRVKGEL
jgi:uncharacterized paraquat-inducible protein A